MVVPPVPPFQPPEPPAELPEPPAMPPDPLRAPPVIAIVPPPLVPSPPAPPAAEPPFLEPPAPLDERPESFVQPTKSVQATIRLIRIVNIMRIACPHIVREVYSKACAFFSIGLLPSILQRFRGLQRIAASDS